MSKDVSPVFARRRVLMVWWKDAGRPTDVSPVFVRLRDGWVSKDGAKVDSSTATDSQKAELLLRHHLPLLGVGLEHQESLRRWIK